MENPGDNPAEDPADPAAPPHDAAGLDLARAAARAAAAAGGPPGLPGGGRRRTTGGTGWVGAPDRRRGRSKGPTFSGSRPDDRDPQGVEGEVRRLVAQRGWELDLRVHGVFGRWAELVGPDVAEHSTPESFVDGRLVVRARATAWATQLRLLAPTLLQRINTELGSGTVTAIEVLGPQGPSWKKGPRSVRDGRGPRDTYG
ncbi:DUF721 domain-containing protein [Nocardioides sp. CPCC 205120]|uniref:DUF721 domain-containing protein n=1 Tax=Nocardioides sp. CPCC 205120 TaxID=3406462 RepID=UPI003B507105